MILNQASIATRGRSGFGVWLALLAAASGLLTTGLSAQTCANAIVCENLLPGDSGWGVSGSGDLTIQGFATDISVATGSTVTFKVNTNATQYRIDIYRIGYYGGAGARKVASVTPSVSLPQAQPACATDATTNLLDCGNWAISASWPVPATAVSGVYVADLIRTDNGGASQIFFVVRNDSSTSDILVQTADLAWQAYNNYGGHSLYGDTSFNLPNRAYKVSYNRPFYTRNFEAATFFYNAEYPMIRWLEANGFDVTYFTGVDAARNGALIKNHKIYMSVGHDEYWSGPQRTNVEAARDAGVNLAFFSGNEVFWKTRWENSIDGTKTPYRTMVCYKETLVGGPSGGVPDPADPPTWTGTWRDPRFSPPADGGRPENALTGTIFMVNGPGTDNTNLSIKVPAADGKMRFWRGTSIATLPSGQTVTLPAGTLGYEWDIDADNGFRPAGTIPLSTATYNLTTDLLLDYGGVYGAGTATHRMTMHRAPSGALVFGAGTVQWAWGLDANHDGSGGGTDVRMQQATINLLADMGIQPGSIQPGLVAATKSLDVTPPSSTITAPAAGSTQQLGIAVTITGTAVDFGPGVVGGVEVSTDGGNTWHAATGRENWTYTWTPTQSGAITIRSRAVDDSANLETPSAGITVNVPIPPISIDRTVSTDSASPNSTVTSPAFSTSGPNELLLAFVAGDYVSGSNTTVTGMTGGGLTWTLVQRTNAQSGNSEIWRALATTTINSASVTATLSQPVIASITVMAFQGVDTSGTNGSGAIGAKASGSAASGAPAAKLTTTRNSSVIVGVGNDYDNPIARTPGASQSLVHQYLTPTGDTYWVQMSSIPVPVSGTAYTMNDTAPTGDRYNFSIVEVLGAAGPTYSISGTVSPLPAASGTVVTLSGAATGSTTVDASGNYSFANLNNGAYTVTPSKTGYTFAPANQAVTVAGANLPGINFTATAIPTYTISGTVSPLPAASGTVVTLSGAATGSTTVDASGNYSFANLNNGAYTVTPSKTGYTFAPTKQAVTVAGANMPGINFTATAVTNPVKDVSVSTDNGSAASSIVSPAFSTTSANELLLAFVATDYISGSNTTVTGVTGGSLTWVLVVRSNTQSGTSEIWRAFAPSTLSGAKVTATLSQSVSASLTVMSFSGVDTTGTNGSGAIGATNTANARPGAPSASLVTTRNGSWVVGVGTDYDNAISRTPGPGQSVVHQYLSPVGDTFWVQMQTSATPLSGTTVTINDSAPTGDRYDLAICEILAHP